ncbi:MAG: helix-turn-helix domain-containing protein [Aminipila sp.]
MGIDYLKQKKKELGFTNEELSKISGVPLGTLNKIFAGQTTDPKFETIKAICGALGVSLAELDNYENNNSVTTIAAHHDSQEWTAEELDEIEQFKKYVLSKRK